MQTDNLLAPLVQLGKALMACIMVAHAKTMRCFAKMIKTSVCRVYRTKLRQLELVYQAAKGAVISAVLREGMRGKSSMAGEDGEGCGDDLNVLGLQVTLRFFWSSSIK